MNSRISKSKDRHAAGVIDSTLLLLIYNKGGELRPRLLLLVSTFFACLQKSVDRSPLVNLNEVCPLWLFLSKSNPGMSVVLRAT